MKRVTVFALSSILLCAVFTRAQGWDAGESAPPPTSDVRPAPQPTKMKPFSFLFYRLCEPRQDTVRWLGKWSFDIMSRYGSVGFDHSETDSSVTLMLRTQNRGTREAELWFPQRPFTLRVILGMDTAVFAVDIPSGKCTYLDTSVLLRMEAPKEMPPNLVWMQFMDRQSDRARNFLKLATARFGTAVDQTVLEEGFYPCMPVPFVERTNIGRRQALNETALGLLVCLRVTDQSQAANISRWIWERQREEFKRADTELGIEGR